MADQDDELADAVRELTRTLEDLRQELDGSSRRRRPRLRPPTPRDVLAFADEVAIPAALAGLESSIRALEAFQRGLELVRTEREVRDRTTDAATAAGTRADEVRETTLSRLDTVLSELQRAASSGALPADEDARDLLAEARQLRDEVDSRLREATRGSEPEPGRAASSESSASSAVEIDIEDGTPEPPETDASPDPDADDSERRESNVDVDAELETLKDQYGDDADGDEPDDDESDDADGTSDAGTGPGDDEDEN